MSTFSGLVLILCFIFGIYKANSYFSKKREEREKVVVKENTFDERFYSSPSFDFPNVQPDWKMRDSDFGVDLAKQSGKIEVTQYCRY